MEVDRRSHLRMDTYKLQSTAQPASFSDTVVVWIVVLLVSDLPDAVWHAVGGVIPEWLFWVKVGELLVVITLSRVWKRWHSLRPFFVLLLILIVGRKVVSYLGGTPSYVARSKQAELLLRLAQFEGLRLLQAAAMVAALLVMGKRRQDFFLAIGDLKKWKRPGIILALSIMVLTFLFFNYPLPSAAILLKALALMPAVLCFAALAAFDEEIRYRGTLLPHLQEVVGKNHAILITAFFFGMGHYFGGVPSGIAGFFIAGTLGWLYATMMMETRGIFMSWFNHFLTNVPTFIFWAIGAVSS
jgi:membrane protease YdiL (CAAX protease family)